MSTFLFILFFIGGLLAYHALFNVWYFDIGKGIFKELIGAGFFAIIMTAIALHYWWVSAIIIILIGLGVSAKVDNPTAKMVVRIVFVVIAILVGISGFSGNKKVREKKKEEAEKYVIDAGTSIKSLKESNKYAEDEIFAPLEEIYPDIFFVLYQDVEENDSIIQEGHTYSCERDNGDLMFLDVQREGHSLDNGDKYPSTIGFYFFYLCSDGYWKNCSPIAVGDSTYMFCPEVLSNCARNDNPYVFGGSSGEIELRSDGSIKVENFFSKWSYDLGVEPFDYDGVYTLISDDHLKIATEALKEVKCRSYEENIAITNSNISPYLQAVSKLREDFYEEMLNTSYYNKEGEIVSFLNISMEEDQVGEVLFCNNADGSSKVGFVYIDTELEDEIFSEYDDAYRCVNTDDSSDIFFLGILFDAEENRIDLIRDGIIESTYYSDINHFGDYFYYYGDN